MNELVAAHLAAQARLRARAAFVVAAAWAGLTSYDEEDVATFTDAVVAATAAINRSSVAVTTAFLARSVGRQPAAVPAAVVLEQLRGGIPPAEVYRRPFVTTWTALAEGRPYEDAVAAGRARATSTAVMDVQLAMRQTLVDVGERTQAIVGYARVPNGGACKFCQTVAGQRYHVAQLMPVHNGCGCGVDVITAANRGDFTGKVENDRVTTSDDGAVKTAVAEHGELGPVLVNADNHFTALPGT